VFYGNSGFNCCPVRRKKQNYMPFTAKGNVMIPEWSACAPTDHVVVRTCRKVEKHCSSMFMNVC
jgi:hypothetical protein